MIVIAFEGDIRVITVRIRPHPAHILARILSTSWTHPARILARNLPTVLPALCPHTVHILAHTLPAHCPHSCLHLARTLFTFLPASCPYPAHILALLHPARILPTFLAALCLQRPTCYAVHNQYWPCPLFPSFPFFLSLSSLYLFFSLSFFSFFLPTRALKSRLVPGSNAPVLPHFLVPWC